MLVIGLFKIHGEVDGEKVDILDCMNKTHVVS